LRKTRAFGDREDGGADISPKTVQTLARHGDIRLTMNLYSHVDLEDQSAAISRLPGIGGKAKNIAG